MDRKLIREILEDCKTLAEAEKELDYILTSRAIMWGLWDGWTDRPYSTAGLFHLDSGTVKMKQETGDYFTGWAEGRNLREQSLKGGDPSNLAAPAVLG